MIVLNSRLISQRVHLMSRARSYSGCTLESLESAGLNADYNRTLFYMYKHYEKSKKVLNFLESRGGHIYGFDK
jgi:hypothetical protein